MFAVEKKASHLIKQASQSSFISEDIPLPKYENI